MRVRGRDRIRGSVKVIVAGRLQGQGQGQGQWYAEVEAEAGVGHLPGMHPVRHLHPELLLLLRRRLRFAPLARLLAVLLIAVAVRADDLAALVRQDGELAAVLEPHAVRRNLPRGHVVRAVQHLQQDGVRGATRKLTGGADSARRGASTTVPAAHLSPSSASKPVVRHSTASPGLKRSVLAFRVRFSCVARQLLKVLAWS